VQRSLLSSRPCPPVFAHDGAERSSAEAPFSSRRRGYGRLEEPQPDTFFVLKYQAGCSTGKKHIHPVSSSVRVWECFKSAGRSTAIDRKKMQLRGLMTLKKNRDLADCANQAKLTSQNYRSLKRISSHRPRSSIFALRDCMKT